MALVRIAPPDFDVDMYLAYATTDNFTGKPVYARADCWLHADAAACLQKAIELAKPLGWRLKIFDAFRPSEAQWVLWNHTPTRNSSPTHAEARPIRGAWRWI